MDIIQVKAPAVFYIASSLEPVLSIPAQLEQTRRILLSSFSAHENVRHS